MKQVLARIVPGILLVFSGLFLSAQQFNLLTYSVEAGLAQSQVYAMCEDQRGYLWFGTRGGGLSRFDGLNFRNFTTREGLVHNYIRCLFEDKDGKLWIGTDRGACYYDGRKFHPFVQSNALSSIGVNAIALDSAGRTWFATDGGLEVLDPASGQQFHLGKENGVPHNLNNSLLVDQEGNVWVGNHLGLLVFGPKTSRDSNILVHYGAKQGLAGLDVRTLLHDSKGIIWIGTYGGGISRFDPSRTPVVHHAPFENMTTLDGLPSPIVLSSYEDREGNIWFGTFQAQGYDGGACRYDGQFFTYFTDEDGMFSNHVFSILEDDWGNIWLGTSGGGVSKFRGERFSHFTERNGISGNRVYAITEDKEGFTWLGTSGGGMTRYNGSEFTRFGRNEGFSEVVVKSLLTDERGTVWIGSQGGGLYTLRDGQFEKYRFPSGMGSAYIRDLAESADGAIWVATAGGGLCGIDTSGACTSVTTAEGLPSNRINCVREDLQGGLWVGTDGMGLSRIKGDEMQNFGLSSGLCSEVIRSLAIGPGGEIWAGTKEGLARLEPGSENFRCLTEQDGLTSSNIYLTLFDLDNNLWAGSEKGVDRIIFNASGAMVEIKHFGRTEGFAGIETCRGAACLDSEGRIWFGTIKGVTHYNPRMEQINPLPPKTQLTGINLFYEDIAQTPFADSLLPWHPIPEGLELPWHKNHLSFEFVGINHKNPQKVTYRWRLLGFESDFTPATFKREATYSNLPPGGYTFEVLAANEDGLWNESPMSFSFVIQRPWWGTWWFRILAALAVGLLIYLLVQARLRGARRRTAQVELEKSMLELEQKALRLQMNPHFIFNALNSIKGCIASNDNAAARRHLVNFARLMRLILDNSRESFIPVESEIQTLRYYLDLEKLSRSDRFDYEIELGEGIEPEMDHIPPMLVQPFVENAVIHGISSLREGGHIAISFRKEGKGMLCLIRDNGIGREAALERKKGKAELHKSRGVSVTEDRLKLLNESGGGEFGIQIVDLKDEKGEATGTEVQLVMPIERD